MTPEMEFAAIRENQNRAAYVKSLDAVSPRSRRILLAQHAGTPFEMQMPETVTGEFVRKEIAKAAPCFPRTSITRNRNRW